MSPEQKDITARVGPIKLDVPRTAGYYGGIGLALALGVVDWPVALFIGAIPAVKLLKGRPARYGLAWALQFFEGAAKPVGGDAEGTIQLEARRAATPQRRAASPRRRAPAAPAAPRRARRAAEG